MTIPIWQALLLTLLAAGSAWRRFQGWLYLCQLDEYQPNRLWRTALRRLRTNWRWQLGLALGAVALAVVAAWPGDSSRLLPLVLVTLLPFGTDRPFGKRGELHWTARARRLAIGAAALTLIALFLSLWRGWPGAVVIGGIDLVLVAALSAGVALLAPDERRRRHQYMHQAELRIAAVGPLVIGVTGSYGKTTTKLFLQQLLDSPESPCFATPESFNTTLGVCRAINEGLRPDHRFAIVEMGAYRQGEIAEICSFTHPQLGIVTTIGVMHLERFGSRQKIAVAKSELLAALPESGVAVLPSALHERELLTAPLRARAVWVGRPQDRWWAEQVSVSPEGSQVRLRGSAGEDLHLTVPLHGGPTLDDLLCAWATAVELGVPIKTLAERVAGLEGPPHRLQVSRANGITIIDDAYNSNPEGAAAALRLLASLPGQRRVLVTPGFIELGPVQEQSMRELGQQAAGVCTHVILVGRIQSVAIAAGLSEAGFPAAQLTVAADLDEAQRRLPDVAGPGSVVLFENDLPDSFLEPG
ncbi:MAG TPA: UDP-N-acetylmuramoyl-tripeptide--D-alanyl-D-alanine ligase [Candidatus Dormibacteraeota bacterium]|nr:UDP-N-acetylmuramoyl-tripeptide--D-alanyl-D-alanine ligase [Candidatus Dormibacteraeota bacterium]